MWGRESKEMSPGESLGREVWVDIKAYIKHNRWMICAMAVLILLLHGRKLVSPVIGIDTEKIIHDSKGLYESWLNIGRQGLVFLKMVLLGREYNSYYAAILTLLFLLGMYVGFGFLFEYVLGKKGDAHSRTIYGRLGAGFGAIVVAHPILTEQLYFTLQSAEIALGFLLTAAGLFYAHLWGERKNLWCLFGAIVVMQITFSVYQAFVPLFLGGSIALILLRAFRGELSSLKEEVHYAIRLETAFLGGLLLNQMVTWFFFREGSYLADQIVWKEEGLLIGLREIYNHMRDVAAGGGAFYFRTFFWLALGLFMGTAWYIKGLLGTGRKIWVMILLAGIYGSPFYMTVLMGMRPVIRSQLVLPFTIGMMVYLLGVILLQAEESSRVQGTLAKVRKYSSKLGILYLLCVGGVTFCEEAINTNRLYATDEMRYQEDCRLAEELKKGIALFTGMEDYDGIIVFVGRKEAELSAACLEGDLIGKSFFDWDTDVDPKNYWSSGRITGFLCCMGGSCVAPDKEQAKAGTEAARDMPCYPQEGSIAWCGEVLVVKLSDE